MTALDFLDAPVTQKRRKAEDFLEEGGGGPESASTLPQERTEQTGPGYVPPELQQAEEQAAIERAAGSYKVPDWLKQVVPQAMRLPAKVAIAGGAMQTGRLKWPTDEEVQTPFVSPDQMKMAMPYAYVADRAKEMFPESTTAQVAAGVTGGAADALSGFTTPENLAMLPIAPGGKIAQRAIAGVFLGQAISGTPEQWEAFNNAPELADKIRIATSMGLGYALPALGAAATLRKPGPKIVEPVKTTQEAATSGEAPSSVPGPSAALENVESRPDLARIDLQRQQSDRPPQTIPRVDTEPARFVSEPSDLPTQLRPQPESISPPASEASPKVASVPVITEARIKEALALLKEQPGTAELYSGIAMSKANLDAVKTRIENAAEAEKPRLQAVQREAETKLNRVIDEVLAAKPAPIQPGIESAIAEIQRRDAPELLPPGSVPKPVERAEVSVPREDLAGRESSPRESAGLPSQPESIPTSTKNATTFAEPGISKIGKSIEAKAVEAKLTQGFEGTANFDPITVKDQAQRATGLIKSSLNDARAVIRGDAPLPEGLRGTSLITAMEEHISRQPNAELAYELANSPLVRATSEAAQEMRLMAERIPDGITAAFHEIREARRAGSKQRGQTPERVVQEVRTEIVRNSSKRPTWEAFVKSLECV